MRIPRVGISVQACGDCHLMNFGAFDTPEGRVLFDINDFDETLPGVDFTADIKRLVASVAVATLDAGVSEKKARSIAKSTAKAYREFILKLANLTPLDVWHTSMELKREVKLIDDANLRNKDPCILMKAEKHLAADDNFPHLASAKGGLLRIEDRPPLIYHFSDATDATACQLCALGIFDLSRDASARAARSHRSLRAQRYRLQGRRRRQRRDILRHRAFRDR